MTDQSKTPRPTALGKNPNDTPGQPQVPASIPHKGGPATDFGKQASSKNHLIHGFRSTQLLLPGESQATLDDFRDCLQRDLKPQGLVETVVFDSIVAAAWRLRRLSGMEAQYFQDLYNQDTVGRIQQRAGQMPDPTVRLGVNVYFAAQHGDPLRTMARYETQLESSFYQALAQLRQLQAGGGRRLMK